MANKPKWGEETFRRVYEMDKAIQLPDNRENYRDIYDGMTYEQTWEYSPAAKLDERFPFPLQIAGSEFEIRLQASFGKWLHDVLGRRLGYLVRFEDFWEQWSEKGFTWAINRVGTPGLSTNYPFRDTEKPDGTEVDGWRVERESRPGFVEWKNPKPSSNPYYRIIEYWPNRSNDGDSYLICGSDSQVIMGIQQIEWLLKMGGSDGGDSKRAVSEAKFLTGFPELHFIFREKYPPLGKSKMEAHFSISMVGWIEAEYLKKYDHDQILNGETLEKWAGRIEEAFFPEKDEERVFELKKGSQIFSYSDWRLGYSSWGAFRSEVDARSFFEKLCYCKEDNFNAEQFTGGKSKPYKERNTRVLGYEQKISSGYRNADLYFWRAYCILPRSKQKITLVSRSVRSPVDLPI